MGSEMCIRDRLVFDRVGDDVRDGDLQLFLVGGVVALVLVGHVWACLLYTSDAADERSSVDLGGRRIIKKKNTRLQIRRGSTYNK